MKWLNRAQAVTIACSAMSAAAAAGATFVITQRVLGKKMQEELSAELDRSREYYQNLYSTPTFVAVTEEPDIPPAEVLLEQVRTESQIMDPVPVDLVGAALEKAREYQGIVKDEPEDERPEPTIVNIFEGHQAPGDEVLNALLATRDPSEPYIITKYEFYSNEPDFEQAGFTFYEGDKILVIDSDEFNPVDSERMAGDENLLRFGYGSEDEEVLYIRNETIDPPMDLHITRVPDHYKVVVQGLDMDEPHLQHMAPRKFRMRDE